MKNLKIEKKLLVTFASFYTMNSLSILKTHYRRYKR